MRQWHFFDKVYRAWVVFCIGPGEDFKQFLEDATYTEPWEELESSGACIKLCAQNTTNGNSCYVLWLKEWQTACLVHELCHLSRFILEDKGVADNHEAFAYYTEYWFNEISRTRRRMPQGRTPSETKRIH